MFLQRRGTGEFPGVNAEERGLERLMPGERIQEDQKVRLVRGGKKTDQALGFIIKRLDLIGGGCVIATSAASGIRSCAAIACECGLAM